MAGDRARVDRRSDANRASARPRAAAALRGARQGLGDGGVVVRLYPAGSGLGRLERRERRGASPLSSGARLPRVLVLLGVKLRIFGGLAQIRRRSQQETRDQNTTGGTAAAPKREPRRVL